MINGGYLIPANTKKGQLIFGLFTPIDLGIFGVGVVVSIILLVSMGAVSTGSSIISLIPALFVSFLVLPIPNYRNVRTFFVSLFEFYSSQRIYKWRGWCLYGQAKK